MSRAHRHCCVLDVRGVVSGYGFRSLLGSARRSSPPPDRPARSARPGPLIFGYGGSPRTGFSPEAIHIYRIQLVGIGTATAVPAAVTGWNDWASLAREQRRVGLIHASSNVLAIGLQAASFGARLSRRRKAGSALSLAGVALAATGAYIGGHLSYRLAAGVNHAAPMLRHIPDGWQRLCRYDELSEASPIARTIADVPILIVREGDVVTAMIEQCAHQGGPLSDGEVISVGGATCVVCPWPQARSV